MDPNADPPATAPKIHPRGRPRCSYGNRSPKSARAIGIIPPLATPPAILHAISCPIERAVAVPAKVKRHLGLDADASWIVLDEANEFVWPGVDLRPISRQKPGVWTYGVLPQELFEDMRVRLRSVLDQRRVRRDARLGRLGNDGQVA